MPPFPDDKLPPLPTDAADELPPLPPFTEDDVPPLPAEAEEELPPLPTEVEQPSQNHVRAITVGAGLSRPQGCRLALAGTDGLSELLANALRATASEVEAWWSPGVFEGDYRQTKRWIGSTAIGVDADYHDATGKHAEVPAAIAAAVESAALAGQVPGSIYHATPRGLRIVLVLAFVEQDGTTWQRAAHGACALVNEWLASANIAATGAGACNGYVLDVPASCDRARLLYTPNAVVRGIQRAANVVVMRQQPYGVHDLAAVAAPPKNSRPHGDERKQEAPRAPTGSSDGTQISDGARNQTLAQIAGALRSRGAGRDEIAAALSAANIARCKPPLDDAEVQQIANSVSRYPVGAAQREHRTELGLARLIVAQHGADLRFCHPWGKWLAWDGRRWKVDDSGEIDRRAKATIAAIYADAANAPKDERAAIARWAIKCEDARVISAGVKLARSEPGIPILPSDLDRDLYLLTVENGTLDVRSGVLHPHKREDLITRLAPVSYDAGATAPTWIGFLDRVFQAKKDLIAFTQRWLGYCLTGDVTEHCMAVAYGTGRNGKSTLFETVAKILGDYSGTVPSDLLLAKRGDAHPTERARLYGLRLAVSSETGAGRRLDEAAMKKITGGDKIDARRMREDFWDFTPTHKLVLYTNHKPDVRTSDEGTWSKMHLLPFTVTIPKADRDRALPVKLWNERGGILQWIVRGAIEWSQNGLGESESVREATAEYRDEQDRFGVWIGACCTIDATAQVPVATLYESYSRWCIGQSEEPVKVHTFSAALTERGFPGRTARVNGTPAKVRVGIRLAGATS